MKHLNLEETNHFLTLRCEALEKELEKKTAALENKSRLLTYYERSLFFKTKEKPPAKYPDCFKPLSESTLSY